MLRGLSGTLRRSVEYTNFIAITKGIVLVNLEIQHGFCYSGLSRTMVCVVEGELGLFLAMLQKLKFG